MKKVVSVLPCGIPSVIICVSDCACCVCTDCVLFSKKSSVFCEKLKSCLNLCNPFWCDIVSYAFAKSLYMASWVCILMCIYVCCLLLLV